ncbi:hypothetical protein CKAH01_07643 [Colletotrichum kahawae]|uniref:Uncharacterized protein n=1 Tax=Colletotrichum kahawae TaxID=34407 RepID=A0AAD9Y3J5_COLKA|nr:hypothetical protein CKAH01_07643 [Colletotrichum kahawae]
MNVVTFMPPVDLTSKPASLDHFWKDTQYTIRARLSALIINTPIADHDSAASVTITGLQGLDDGWPARGEDRHNSGNSKTFGAFQQGLTV